MATLFKVPSNAVELIHHLHPTPQCNLVVYLTHFMELLVRVAPNETQDHGSSKGYLCRVTAWLGEVYSPWQFIMYVPRPWLLFVRCRLPSEFTFPSYFGASWTVRIATVRHFGNKFSRALTYMVVSQNRGTPIYTPKYYSPYYREAPKWHP